MPITPERRAAINNLADKLIVPGKDLADIRTIIHELITALILRDKEEKKEFLKACFVAAEKKFSGVHSDYITRVKEAVIGALSTEEPTDESPVTAPPPSPPPAGEGTEQEPTPEVSPEAPGFSRYLKDILASSERNNLLKKLAGPNGRLWIDKKVKNTDGSERTVRIWLSLDLTLLEQIKSEDELKRIIDIKLQDAAKNPNLPLPFRFRVDDLSTGNSWKEKWATKKTEVNSLITNITAAPDAERPLAILALGRALFGPDEDSHEQNIKEFIALLQQYLARPDGKTDIWTHVRNAYWHADGWQDERIAQAALTGHGITTPFTRPTYESARMREWEKIEGNHRTFLESKIGTETTLHYRGTPLARGPIAQKSIADGPAKGVWYSVDTHWIHVENLRISYKYNRDGTKVEPPIFELLAWQVQAEEPKEPPATPPATPHPPTSPSKPKGPTTPAGSPAVPPKKGPQPPATPSAASGGPKPPPKSPPIIPNPAAKMKGGTDATPAPKESHESAEVLREREVIAIPDIHGEANALLTSLKAAGYIKPKNAKWNEEWHLTEAGKKAHIIFTGDLLDRGSENIGVLEIVKKLRAEGARIEILSGNHEMILLNTLQSSHQSDWLHWIGEGGGSVLKELGEHANISTNAVTILDVLSYLPHMARHKKNFAGMPPVTASCAELLRWWKKNSSKITQTLNDPTNQSIRSILEQTLITDADIAAFGKLQERAKETFLVQYGEMVKSLNLMTIVDDVLYVHASLNEYWIDMLEREGIDGVNREFHTAIKDPIKLKEMAGSTGQYGDVMWDRNLQAKLKKKPELIQRLKQLGICMIVHGHTETNGAQMHNTVDNLHIVNGDVSMYRRPGGAFVRVRGRRHNENGKVEGFVGASRSPYDKTGYTALASLSPGKEKPAPTTTVSGAVPAPKQPAKPGPAKAPGAAPPKIASLSDSLPAPVTTESLRKQLEESKDVLPPTAENLTEQWLRANRGKKLLLKLREGGDPQPCIIGCLASKPRHDTAGRVCLCFVHSSGRIYWHKTFDIAELRRLNLPPAPP